MNYAELEDAIVAHLKTKLGTAADVVALPDNQLESQKHRGPVDKPLCTVFYNASEFAEGRYGNRIPRLTTDGTTQMENINIKVEIRARSRRGNSGVLAALILVRRAMVGAKIGDFDQFGVLDSSFVDYSENIFTYQICFGTKGLTVIDEQSNEHDPVGEVVSSDVKPPLVQVDFDDLYPEN